MTFEKTYLSESELGRILNVPQPRLKKALAANDIRPDLIQGPKLHLFDRARIEQIREAVTR